MKKPISLVISILSIALLVACGGGGNPPSKRETKLEKELQALEQEKEQKLAAVKKFFEASMPPKQKTEIINRIDSIVKGAKHELLINFQKSSLALQGTEEPEEFLKTLESKDPTSLSPVEQGQLEFLRACSPLIEILEKEQKKQEELANLRKKHK